MQSTNNRCVGVFRLVLVASLLFALSACSFTPVRNALEDESLSSTQYVGIAAGTIESLANTTARAKVSNLISNNVKHGLLDKLQEAQDGVEVTQNALEAKCDAELEAIADPTQRLGHVCTATVPRTSAEQIRDLLVYVRIELIKYGVKLAASSEPLIK